MRSKANLPETGKFETIELSTNENQATVSMLKVTAK
jgi:hypothetical protein